ncbi:MAG: CinA-like protein [Chlamydiae bacterium]|nr:CinA-like protein [Chlamydiota bacterium]
MTLEILSIGNELLAGFTINSNAAVIGQRLLLSGLTVDRVTLLPDEPSRLKAGIEEAMERSSFIITTGGLGPTGDDLTRDIVAEIFGTTLIYDDAVAEDLIERFSSTLPTLKDQAMVPQGATIFQNPIGTAPGFILSNEKSTVIVLPGVPSQMEALLEEVIPYLEKECKKKSLVKSLYLCQLSEQSVDPLLRTIEKENPALQIGICPSYGTLYIHIHAEEQELIDLASEKILQEFEPYLYSTTSKQIEHAIHEWMIDHKKSFACGESCTGGAMAARLTVISGASDYFLGAIVAYSDTLKQSALNVARESLERYGAVSEEVVREMALGTLKLTGADYVITISGIAGPKGGSEEKPVGTICAAIATKEEIFTGTFLSRGAQKRALVIDYSVTYLLSELWRYLKQNRRPFT